MVFCGLCPRVFAPSVRLFGPAALLFVAAQRLLSASPRLFAACYARSGCLPLRGGFLLRAFARFACRGRNTICVTQTAKG